MASIRLAWRNLWRNRKRTAITLAAISLNTAILIASSALMDGMLVNMVRNTTDLVVGEVQVHAPGYLADRSLYRALDDPDAILRAARSQGIDAAPRVYGYGLIAHGTKSAGARFCGVDPARERATFALAEHVERGGWLPERPGRGVVLGKKLAKSLNATVGSEVVAVVQAADGSLGNEIFTVTGILKTVGETVDRNAAMLHEADFRALFVLPARVHEVALNSRGAVPLDRVASIAAAAAGGDEVKTWRELMAQLADMVNLTDVSMWIFGGIFFVAAGLGVMNTMLMATYERIHEFGVLKAIGATPLRIVRDVLAEALVLSAVATAIGTAAGLAGALYLQAVGIDTSAFAGETSFAGVAFDPVWHARVGAGSVVGPVGVMWAICVLSALYPAVIAARLDPVRAIGRI
jgi:ABC-type lipoprotein release transport system permease subunit